MQLCDGYAQRTTQGGGVLDAGASACIAVQLWWWWWWWCWWAGCEGGVCDAAVVENRQKQQGGEWQAGACFLTGPPAAAARVSSGLSGPDGFRFATPLVQGARAGCVQVRGGSCGLAQLGRRFIGGSGMGCTRTARAAARGRGKTSIGGGQHRAACAAGACAYACARAPALAVAEGRAGAFAWHAGACMCVRG